MCFKTTKSKMNNRIFSMCLTFSFSVSLRPEAEVLCSSSCLHTGGFRERQFGIKTELRRTSHLLGRGGEKRET